MLDILTSKEFNDDYARLKTRAAGGNGEAKTILELIVKASERLRNDKEAGVHIPRKLWPKEYVQKYQITNLWKYNLDPNWRLIYTISGDKVRLVLVYLEYMDHTEYNRRFGYKSG
jgi:addiction module RelE/StbE family toxin